ncbi:uncharacterized protein LOC111630525 [Centruroides sculpturatus]|uniref:uncharacterized protein LOC111630525 n=1 Tax=Centruroides sculpturatus TaxID=218467 RepID=UPI000C6E655A|nr:uncharacterized protein LOC111630525 [Centruroides sculpturatus]
MKPHIKYLGVHIDPTLSWNYHIEETCHKIKQKANMINHIARNTWGLSAKHCRLIYSGAIEPALLYAAEIWGKRVNIIHNKRKLLSIQRGFAIRICRAYRTAPTDALLTIANMTPINIKIKTRVWKWHLLQDNIQDLDTEKIQNLVTNNHLPSAEIVNKIKLHGIDRHISTFATLCHPASSTNDIISTVYNPEDRIADWHVYTDGAKNDLGTGSAFVIYKTSTNKIVHEEFHKLCTHCSNNQAELWAMCKALATVTNHCRNFKGGITFFTDSRYVLSVIRGTRKLTATGIKVYHLAMNLSQRKNISFRWVPGHHNIPGNEKADKLAKRATELLISPSFGLIPTSYISNHLHERSTDLWEGEWNNSTTGRTTFSFLPSIHKRQRYKYITPSFYLTQCLTGHGNIPSYLHRIGRRSNATCPCDNSSVGDSFHILFDCPLYEPYRSDLISFCNSHGQSWPPNLDYLCAHKDSFDHFLKFVNSCNAFANDFSTRSDDEDLAN